jgi:Alpha/beta hydrolase domain
MDYVDASFQRDGVFKDSAGRAMSLTELVAKGSCAVTPLWSRVPNDAVLKAALSALHAWIEKEPPTVDRLVPDSSGKPAMDDVGREIGGLRTAAYDVPISKTGVNTGGGFCRLANYHVDFTPTELCARYGSQAAYADLVRRQTQKNVESRVLLPAEATVMTEQASKVKFDCK